MKKENIYTDEERYWMIGGNGGTLPTRITPSKIYSLAPDEVFVFGSNALGMHHGGAARVAYNEFGAEWGNGEGMQGQSYAIPTMEGEHNTLLAIRRFIRYAQEHPELKYILSSNCHTNARGNIRINSDIFSPSQSEQALFGLMA